MDYQLPRPRWWLRLLLRLPLLLYRAGLGWVMGSRFLMLTHTGRKSGKARQTVLEVVGYDRVRGKFVVACCWGQSADWFRNISHNPKVYVTVGNRSYTAEAIKLTLEQAEVSMLEYAHRNRLAFRVMSKVVGQREFSVEEACLLAARVFPVVELRVQVDSMARM